MIRETIKSGERRWLRPLIRLVLTGGFCAVLVAIVDLGGVVDQMRRADPVDVGLSVAFLLLTYPFMTVRWQLILRHDGVEVRFVPLLLIYVESGFFSLFLPSAIGGDVFRATRVHALLGGVRRTTVNLLTERLIGVWAVCSLAVVALAVSRPAADHILWTVVIALAGVAVASALAISRAAQGVVNRVLTGLRLRRFAALHDQMFEQFHDYMRRPLWVGRLIVLSIFLQTFTVVSIFFVSRATGLDLDLWFYMLVMPVVWLLSLIPAIGGVGPREAGIVYFLVAAGVEREPAVAVAVLALGVTVVKGLVGGALFLVRSLSPRR